MINQTFSDDSMDESSTTEVFASNSASAREQIPDFLSRILQETAPGADAQGQSQLLGATPRGIPTELREVAQWLVWRGEWKPGQNGKPNKWNKVPFQINGSFARVNEPASWTNFPAACRAYLESHDTNSGIAPFHGVGFTLTRENGIVGIDMDDAINPATGTIKSQAIAVIELLNSYAEVSPSGTGLRLFVRGELPPKGRVRNQGDGSKYEVYDGGRYLTVTGRKLPGSPATIEDRGEELLKFHADYIAAPADAASTHQDNASGEARGEAHRIVPNALSDDELLEKARNSRKGAEFAALWNGELEHPELARCKQDHSSADLALCNRLAFWAGRDPERMDRLFRRSGLMRDKWDTRHSSDGRTYGQMTIERAIERCKRCFGEREPGTGGDVVFSDIEAKDIPPANEMAGRDGIYGEGQLLKLLYPTWNEGSLTSEAAHARRLGQAFDGDLRYSAKLGWLFFTGKIWERDDKDAHRTTAEVAKLSGVVRAEITRLYELAAKLAHADRQSDAGAMTLAARRYARHIKTAETRRFIKDTLELAAGALLIAVETFDVRPSLLGFQNLVWDGGERRPHLREDYLMTLSPVEIQTRAIEDAQMNAVAEGNVAAEGNAGAEEKVDAEGNADTEKNGASQRREKNDWELVLERMSQGDADLERTLQDVVGYVLSGKADLRIILWFYGVGGTGKSTVAELIETLLGGGTYAVSPGKLHASSDRERLGAALWNCRLAICSEAANQKLDAETLKMLSGGDTMSARFLFKEVFTIRPAHVLMMISNFAPRVDSYDEALKDRVLVLPFVNQLIQGGMLDLSGNSSSAAVTSEGGSSEGGSSKKGSIRIESARKDPNSSLVRGFTEWALIGLERVHHSGDIYRCEVVEKASKKFWEDTDALGEFWEMMPLKLMGDGIGKSDLRALYEQWCQSENIVAFSRPIWNRACESVGLLEVRQGKTNTRCWRMPALRVQQLLASSGEEVNQQVASRVLNIYGRKLAMNKSVYNTFVFMARQEGWEEPMKVKASVEAQMKEWFGL